MTNTPICSCESHLSVNASKQDPTRTLTLRNAFSREMTRRFRSIKRDIWDAVVKKDVFGLKGDNILTRNATPPAGAFAFRTDAGKVEGFMNWLQGRVDEGIFEISAGQKRQVLGNVPWSNIYVDTAYKKGIRRADNELVKVLPDYATNRTIDSRFMTPFHADKVALIYQRVYTDLRNVTNTMEGEMQSVLAEGIANGDGPRKIARALQNRIEKSGGELALTDTRGTVRMRALQRANMIARTEVVRAHHVATINTYREAGVEGVRVKAEWSTAGDDRVCPDCASLEGQVFTLDQIEPLIPLHPLCRCVALPIDSKDKGNIKTDEEISDAVGDQYKTKDGSFARRGFFEEKTGKPLPKAPKTGEKIGKSLKGVPAPGKKIGKRRAKSIKTADGEKLSSREEFDGRRVFKTDGVKYMPEARDANSKGTTQIVVDMKSLNRNWKRNSTSYISKSDDGIVSAGLNKSGTIAKDNKGNVIQKSRKEWFKDFRKQHPKTPVESPYITVKDDGLVDFANGRHRTAVLRDSEKRKSIIVSVDKTDVKNVQKYLGKKEIK